jgi:hypothetical protein
MGKYDPKMSRFYRERAKARRNPVYGPVVRMCRGCGEPSASPRHWYCEPCGAKAAQRRRERSHDDRPNRQARGYDATYDRERRRWVRVVARGGVVCPYCRRLIHPDEPWDLGHEGDEKSRPTAPWHRGCNRSYAARITGPRRRQSNTQPKETP